MHSKSNWSSSLFTSRQRAASVPQSLSLLPRGNIFDNEDEENKTPNDSDYQFYPMTKITESLYLGCDRDAQDEVTLREKKITHCLSMVARKWDKGTKNIKRKCVPMSDTGNS